MSDIRNTFAKIILFMPNETKEDSVRLIDALAEAAGRAHDVDGLIAEIHKIGGMSYNIAWGEAIDECLHIIRKHFGKE